MNNYIYLLVDLGAILIPLLFSFHPTLKFYKKWKPTLITIFSVAFIFILWDIAYTKIGVWGFNPEYLCGIYLFNLPLEEVLFFICIPYACVFTYYCLKLTRTLGYSQYTSWITYKLCIALLVFGVTFVSNLYTSVTLISLAILLFLIQISYKPIWLPRLYFSLLVLIVPFLVVNGILTGTGLESPIVWYNEEEIVGLRILTIPIEDFFYGFLLILLNVFCLEFMDEKFFSRS